jgi:hypothetical protein
MLAPLIHSPRIVHRITGGVNAAGVATWWYTEWCIVKEADMANALVTIYETQGILTAEVIKGKLEAAGIPALLKYESAGIVLGVTVDGLGKVQVQVPVAWEAEALAVVDETSADDGEDDEVDEDAEPT